MNRDQVPELRSGLFDRFVDQFGEFVDLDEAVHCWRALHTPSGEAGQLQFGVSEFSISLRSQCDVSLRWLAETLRRQPFNEATAERAREIAHCVFTALRGPSRSDHLRGKFDRLFDLVYRDGGSKGPPSVFRIGYALEFRQARPPCFRWYAEPRTAGPDRVFERVTRIADCLGVDQHWSVADETIRRFIPNVSLRGIGVDLSSQMATNLKVYYSTRACDWSQLQDVSEFATQRGRCASLERFHQLILKGRRRMPPNTVLLAVALTPLLDPRTLVVKWDVFLPQLHTSDGSLQERIALLCVQLGLDPAPYLRLWDVVVGSHSPGRLVNVHQYASLDILPDGGPKLNVYLRGTQRFSEHVPLAMRPRSLDARAGEGRIATAVQRGLVSLADARETGYAEMTHRMVFPRSAGFSNDEPCCLGSVFHRATVCRTLAMARAKYDVDQAALQDDLSYLLSQQDAVSGGWKYFPTLAELPPDLDDVAQVLLAFLQAGHSQTGEIFSDILNLVERQVNPTRAQVSTWLVDSTATDATSQLYRRAIGQWWGDGADPEVLANLAFALWQIDKCRFGKWILRACEWLGSIQEDEGWWQSTWYWGRTYGTWMAVRLLAAIRRADPALARAGEWWINSRSKDGHWDASSPSALQTAFGLEAGVELARAGVLARGRNILRRTADWLCDSQGDDGGWDPSPFIRMDVSRAASQKGSAQPKYQSYSSRTISTAFCVQALLDFLSLPTS